MGASIHLPWFFAILAGAWFAFACWRCGRSWLAWSLGAFFGALALTTIVFGVVYSAATPFSQHDWEVLRIKTAIILLVILAALGAAATAAFFKPRPPTDLSRRA